MAGDTNSIPESPANQEHLIIDGCSIGEESLGVAVAGSEVEEIRAIETVEVFEKSVQQSNSGRAITEFFGKSGFGILIDTLKLISDDISHGRAIAREQVGAATFPTGPGL